MLTFEQIKELIEMVSSHRLSGVELERSGFRLKIDGERAAEGAAPAAHPHLVAGRSPAPAAVPAPPAAAAGAAEPQAAPEAAENAAPAGAEPVSGSGPPGSGPPGAGPPSAGPGSGLPPGTHLLSSPIVGTFYAAPNPDASPFVRVGDRVEQGQVLCIVEAMKLMNEIESDVDGVVLEIYPTNAQPVEFGEPLFAIRPR